MENLNEKWRIRIQENTSYKQKNTITNYIYIFFF